MAPTEGIKISCFFFFVHLVPKIIAFAVLYFIFLRKLLPVVLFGPIRTSGQVLNVITFLTKTRLSRQVRDILKKTKGVIIITIALHVLLASWYISRHGRLMQISNNQAGPRDERF